MALIVFGGIGYYAYKSGQIRLPASQRGEPDGQVKFTPSQKASVPSPTPDPTANWETYNNTSATYSIKYPPNWEIVNYGLMDTKPADPDTKYVSLRFQPDVSKAVISVEIEETTNIPESQEVKLNEAKTIGNQSSQCWTTGDSMTTFCWIKVPNMQKYLNFHINNYNDADDKQAIDQILSTFEFIED